MAEIQEYQLLTKEQISSTGASIDTLEFLNEIGLDGWIAMEIREQVVASGMVTDEGKPIPKVVLMVLARRPKLSQERPA